jgi:hypothetical protein
MIPMKYAVIAARILLGLPFLVFGLIAAILLLIGRYVPVALVILGPILVVILLYHVTLDPSELIMPGVLALLEVFLIYAKWPAFHGIFTA